MKRAAFVVVAYCAAFVALDMLSHAYAGRPSASPWYLPAALGFYLVYTLGPRYALLPLLGEMVNFATAGQWQHLPYPSYLGFGVEMTLAYSSAALLLRDVVGVHLPFRGLRDAFWYIGVAVFAAPALAGVLGVTNLCINGMMTWSLFSREVLTFSIGDSMGCLTLVPALAVFVTPYLAREQAVPRVPEERRVGALEASAMIGSVVAVSYLGYLWLEFGGSAPIYYFLFLPLVWMAARGGARYATIGIFFADACVVALEYWFKTPIQQSLAYQSYLASSAVTALTLGAVMNQRWAEFAADLERARVDRVTGLPNPQALDGWLAGYHFHRPVTLLLISIDNLNWVHEGLHRPGVDAFLRGVADRLREPALADPSLGYRYLAHASDAEFALLVSGEDKMIVEAFAERVRLAFAKPMDVNGDELYAAISIGIASSGDRNRARLLVPHATKALENASAAGMESVAFYVEREGEEALISLAAQLHQAVARGEFDVFYQPIFSLPKQPREGEKLLGARISGVEALLRWNHPQRGLLTPFHFIELLESMSLAASVGEIVVRKACDQLARWHAKGVQMDLWINGFVRQVLDPEFAGSLRATLLSAGIDPSSVVVELLEHEFARDEGVLLDSALRLRQCGVRVAIDDFGTGHSSLARLKELSFDRLKIDRSFVAGLGLDRRSEGVVTTLQSLARDFDVPALAEGVETEAQLRFLIENHFNYVQGFYLGLPMTPLEIDALLFEANVIT